MGRPKRTDLPVGIGQEPDHVVAERAGLTRQAVQSIRKANGIPATREPYRSQQIALMAMQEDGLGLRFDPWDGSF